MYFRGCPIQWRSSRQTVRAGSTFESEFIAGSDGLVLSENVTFRGFYDSPGSGERDSEMDLWMDNETAVTVSKKPTDEQRPRSRHVALRHHKVKDFCENIHFCPTEHMKADSLTKIGVAKEVRDNIFYHNPNMVNSRKWKEVEAEAENFFVVSCVSFADLTWLDSD